MGKLLKAVISFFRTLLCFLIACLMVPILGVSFLCVHYGNELVNYILSIKYPTLTISKSKKIRTLIDTPRNAGIFNFLLRINGPCDFEKIRQHYIDNLTDIKDKWNYLRFPKLRQKLVTCWGHYAWVNDISTFNINNHVFLSSGSYRGRPVNDQNIEAFVSELVTKYIPSDLPQWQVIVIPTSTLTITNLSENDEGINNVKHDDHFYVLVKVHHLIIAEEDDLHVSEILMLQDNDRIDRNLINVDDHSNIQKSTNLSYFVRQPKHIQNLLRQITTAIINRWYQFIYEFESLETPDGNRRIQIINISQLLSILLIIIVNVYIDFWKTVKAKNKLRNRRHIIKDNCSYWSILIKLLHNEVEERNLSWQIAYNAFRTSIRPANMTKALTKFLWQFNTNNIILFPYHMYCEFLAIKDIIISGHTNLTSTHFGRLSIYVPMLIYAQLEFFKICYEIYKAPVNIYEALLINPSKESNILQMKSYSGRKIISFSKAIDAKALRERNIFDEEIRESDFVFSCLAGALYDYFKAFEKSAQVPVILNTTCRTIAKGYLTQQFGNKFDNIGGIVFMQLPLQIPNRDHSCQMHNIIENIRRHQIMIYLASMGQTKFDIFTSLIPKVLTKICINFFALNFPVTITEIYGNTSEFRTTWGQYVDDVLLFRPPQSKTCLSLNIHRFGNKYRLAIIADTQLGPDHSKIAESFEKYMENVYI